MYGKQNIQNPQVSKYYGWNIPYPKLTSGDGDKTKESYGIKCKTGDIVEMILDLSKRQLMYNVNGVSQGIAFKDIDKCSYIACINLEHADTAIELLSADNAGSSGLN